MKTQNNIKVLLENKDLRENALFILDPGCDTDIRNCAQVGASVLIPNLTMSAHLMAVTVIRESKRLIATTLEMWESLQKLRALPPETEVCSGHEYTSANGKFAATLEPDNPRLISRIEAVAAAREKGEATVPSKLEEELATNPFLRSDVASFQEAVGMQGADPAEVFKEIRSRKDNF